MIQRILYKKANKARHLRYFYKFNLIIISLMVFIWHSQIIQAQNTPVTYPQIITALNSKVPNSVFKNKTQVVNFLIKDIKKRKVDKPLSKETESLLIQSGATKQLIQIIKENTPEPKAAQTTPKGNLNNSSASPEVKNAKFYYNRGISYVKKADSYKNQNDDSNAKKHYDLALDEFSEATKLDSNYADAYAEIGLIYKQQGQPKLAVDALTKATDIKDFDNPKIYYALGELLNNLKIYDKAIRNLTKAINLNTPKQEETYYLRASALNKSDKYDEAIKDFDKVIELNPSNFEAHFLRGNIYHNRKEYDKAIQDYTMAIELKPENSLYYLNRGKAYKSNGNPSQAIRDCTKVIELEPQNYAGYICRGELHNKNDNYRQAIADLTKGLEIMDGYSNKKMASPYYYERAIAYENSKNSTEAIADYQKVLKLNPQNEEAKTKLKNLLNQNQAPTSTAENQSVMSSTKAKAIHLPKPSYPAAARAIGAKGTIKVMVLIDEEGNVASARAITEGNNLLKDAALSAAKKAKFKPTYKDGKPVKVYGYIVYKF